MNVHIGYKVQKTPDIEKEIHVHVEKLRRRLQVFRPELVHLKGTVEQNPAREGTQVSLNLRLPSGQMVSQQSASNATSAIKAAFDDVLQQITRHKDLLRSAHKWRRRGSTNGVEVGVPFEADPRCGPSSKDLSGGRAFIRQRQSGTLSAVRRARILFPPGRG